MTERVWHAVVNPNFKHIAGWRRHGGARRPGGWHAAYVSLVHFVQGNATPGLVAKEFLQGAGLAGSDPPWQDHLRRLVAEAINPGEDERMIRGALSAGWAIGTSGWRKALARPEWRSAGCPHGPFRIKAHELVCQGA